VPMDKTGKKNPIGKAEFHRQLREWFNGTNEPQVGPGQSQHMVIHDGTEYYRFDADTKRPAVGEYLAYVERYGDSISWEIRKSARDKDTKIAIGPDSVVMSSLFLYHLPTGKSKQPDLLLGSSDADESPAIETVQLDVRAVVSQQIRRRRGQRKFRDALRKRYRDTCVVTGCGIVDLLEAAHIKTMVGVDVNSPENGLLLRADIHTLFDLNLLWIEPDTLKVCLDASIAKSEYAGYDGRTLRDHTGKPLMHKNAPSSEALRDRIRAFK
jgi:hypothetical protein